MNDNIKKIKNDFEKISTGEKPLFSGSSKYYIFTINNYTDEDEDGIQLGVSKEDSQVLYLIYGHEIAPTTGTPHLQGYVEFHKKVRVSHFIKHLCKRAHLEVRSKFATAQHNQTYCKKQDPDHFFEYGEPSVKQQGKRSDLDIAMSEIRKGITIAKLYEIMPDIAARYPRFIEKYYGLKELSRPLDTPVEVTWIYGPTGVGKTRSVHSHYPHTFVPQSYKWWDGYDRHDVVLIDDFRADFCKFHELLKLLDRYPFKVEVKGGMRQFCATKIFITCPYHPLDVYLNRTDEDLAQLTRRIKTIIQFNMSDKDYLKFI